MKARNGKRVLPNSIPSLSDESRALPILFPSLSDENR